MLNKNIIIYSDKKNNKKKKSPIANNQPIQLGKIVRSPRRRSRKSSRRGQSYITKDRRDSYLNKTRNMDICQDNSHSLDHRHIRSTPEQTSPRHNSIVHASRRIKSSNRRNSTNQYKNHRINSSDLYESHIRRDNSYSYDSSGNSENNDNLSNNSSISSYEKISNSSSNNSIDKKKIIIKFYLL